MALSPFVVVVQDDLGEVQSGAELTFEDAVRSDRAVTVYSRSSDAVYTAMSAPYATDANGRFKCWFVNGLVSWTETHGLVTSDPAEFRAFAGTGREGAWSASPAAAIPVSSSVVVPATAVDNLLGTIRVEIDFSHDHMANVVIMLSPPWETTLGFAQLPYAALDGLGDPLDGAEIEIRDALTGSVAVLTDGGGTPLATPYLTSTGTLGGITARLPAGIYEYRVPTSANLTNWTAEAAANFSISLYRGPGNAHTGMPDFAFDGTVTFVDEQADFDSDNTWTFSAGDTLKGFTRSNLVGGSLPGTSDGTWKLWIAGAGTGTLDSVVLEAVPV